jgi:hypothetical protein
MPENHERHLTDDDVKALADELEDRLTDRFYGNLGRGMWALAWKAIITAILGIIAYGSLKGFK